MNRTLRLLAISIVVVGAMAAIAATTSTQRSTPPIVPPVITAPAGSAAVEQKARDFIGALTASVKVRRYAEAYLDHLLADAPEPPEFKAGQGQPSFSYLRKRIDRLLNEQDT